MRGFKKFALLTSFFVLVIYIKINKNIKVSALSGGFVFYQTTMDKSQQGYIALISVIIISVVLILLSVSLATSGFFTRFNVLDAESKQQSNWLTESCVNLAVLHLAEGSTGIGNINVGSRSCNIVSVTNNSPLTGQVTILAKAITAQAVANLQVIINSTDFSLVSWQELPSL